jgi:hypothetical protein
MTDLVTRARTFATEAHQRIDQRRKYTHQPYQEHLKAVAGLVAQVSDDPEMLAAAWLHDTVEDTPATFGDVEREFGAAVRELVAELTDVSSPSDGNRDLRKAIDRQHTARASSRAKMVKLADLIDNCRDICVHDQRFARVYLTEAAALLEVLADGDAGLYRRAQKTVADCARRLGLPQPPQSTADDDGWRPPPDPSLSQRRGLGLFTTAFTAREIALPLRSFDAERPVAALVGQAQAARLELAGVRRDGVCIGYLRTDCKPDCDPADALRAFAPAQVLRGDSSLSEVVRVLTRYDFCFVTAMEDEQERAAFGLPTKGAAKRVMRDLESLRNNLAHAQDIVSQDWPQIARLAERVEELMHRQGGGGLGW